MKRMLIMCAVVLAAGVASAQTPKPATAADSPKARAAVVAKPEPPAQPVNIKIEVTITDQTGANQPAKKVISMIVGDRQHNSIRSSASVPVRSFPAGPNMTPVFNYRNVTINVDARPVVFAKENTKIAMDFGLQYLPKSGGGAEELEPGMSQLNETLGLVLESGKPMIVSQAADPTSDRKITVEVTATIIK